MSPASVKGRRKEQLAGQGMGQRSNFFSGRWIALLATAVGGTTGIVALYWNCYRMENR